MKYEVLYQLQPMWTVGEDSADARTRSSDHDDHYPGDYSGMVLAVRNALAKSPSLRHMADSRRPVITLDLTEEQAIRLRSRRDKIAAGTPTPTTLVDRHGKRVAAVLTACFDSPESLEAASDDSDDNIRFRQIATLEAKCLPETIAHTGTGLYCTKALPTHNDDTQSGAPAGQVVTLVTGGLGGASAFAGGYVTNATRTETRSIVSHTDGTVTLEGSLTNWLDTDDLDIYDAWSVVQTMLTQLWTDQGSTVFSAEQEIRIYDGTYDEAVTLNSSLRPVAQYRLKVAAASGNTSVTIINTTASGSDTFDCNNVDNIRFEDFTITDAGGVVALENLGVSCICDGMALTSTAIGPSIRPASTGTCLFLDCVFDGFSRISLYGALYVRCTFRGGYLAGNFSQSHFEGCVFDGASFEWYASATYPAPANPQRIVNCTFYDTDYFITYYGEGDTGANRIALEVRNCVFHTATGSVFRMLRAPGIVRSDGNCFYNCTKIATVDGTDYDDLAAWRAFADGEGDSPDANSFESNPSLTDPANDDFTLGASSPCHNAGLGSGVQTDAAGNTRHAYRPSVGVSETTGATGKAISWADADLTATPSVRRNVTDLSWTAATHPSNYSYIIEYLIEQDPGTGYETVAITTATSFSLAGVDSGATVRITARCPELTTGWTSPSANGSVVLSSDHITGKAYTFAG